MEKKINIRLLVLAVLLIFVWSAMLMVDVSEWYAQAVYPSVYGLLSRFSSRFPFSVGDCFIYGSIFGLIVYLIYATVRGKGFWRRVGRIVEYLAWVYVWFYLAWGLNYFRHDYYTRAQVTPVSFSIDDFQVFLDRYTVGLHEAWTPVEAVKPEAIESEVKEKYRKLPQRNGLARPTDYLRVKPMLSSRLMSKVGVKGYMGPFFSEFNINRNLPPSMYAFTYTHEMAHVLGITNEAEANLYAYLICTSSEMQEVRFSGYQALFPYVWSNARRLLPSHLFEEWKSGLDPEFIAYYNENVDYLRALYDPRIGEMQDRVYNLFLKGNKISSGTANYSEVIGLLIALQKKTRRARKD